MFISCLLLRGRQRSARGADDLQKVGGLERRAADQSAIDVGLAQQFRSVRRIHAAAIKEADCRGMLAGGMVLAIPVVGFTSSRSAGVWMHRLGLMEIPEESAPPKVLVRAAELRRAAAEAHPAG